VPAMEMFLTAHGYLAGKVPVSAWVREAGLAIADEPWGAAREELRRRRAGQGLWSPPRILDRREFPYRPPDTQAGPDLASSGATRLRPAGWSEDELQKGLAKAAARARRERVELTQRRLRNWATEDPEIPSWSVVDRAARAQGSTAGEWLREAGQPKRAQGEHRSAAEDSTGGR
jgi:hypothetical protein